MRHIIQSTVTCHFIIPSTMHVNQLAAAYDLLSSNKFPTIYFIEQPGRKYSYSTIQIANTNCTEIFSLSAV